MPEILDSLAADDPRAVRSRRDLRMINRLMGNYRWMMRQAVELEKLGIRRVVELGAGDGLLISGVLRRCPQLHGVAVDLQAADRKLAGVDRLEWVQGDLMEIDVDVSSSLVMANLFLHHFEADDLARIGERVRDAAALLVCEPERHWLPLWQGRLIRPWVNEVTRHDMEVSIRAGFRGAELIEALRLGDDWVWQASRGWCGAHRVKGVRK